MFRNVRYFCQIKGIEYSENYKCMTEYMKRLEEETLRTVRKDAGSKSVRKHIGNGKLLIRDRIDRLIDRNAAFLEIGQLAAHFENDRKEESLRSGGLVCGIGPISGYVNDLFQLKIIRINCMIIGNDASVKGGTYYPITVKKHLRAQEIAIENRLPCIYLVDSGGANLWHQKDIFPDKNHFGRIFFNQAKMSTENISQLSIVMGSCTAGGAYIPAMSDQSIIVRDQGSIFLAGPPLVKASTGEIVDAENLGGARMHCSQSGLTDFLADDDLHAIEIARQLISRQFGHLSSDLGCFSLSPTDCIVNRSNDLYGLISSDLKKPFSLRVLLQSICSNYVEFKENYGETLICAFAEIGKHSVGLLANNGVLMSESALKGCHFIQLCNQKQIPIVFFQNTTGFMVGEQSERNGIAKNGAKLIKAISCAKIPKITIITANSYGAGNFAMCGRGFSPNFLFMYPNAKISVMGDQQADLVLGQLAEKKSSATSTAAIDENSAVRPKLTIGEKIVSEQNAFFSSANLWDDGLIDPNDTETVLSLCLDICKQKNYFASRESKIDTNNNFGIFRM